MDGDGSSDGEVLQVKMVSAADDDDVYAVVDDEMTLCMGLPVQQKL